MENMENKIIKAPFTDEQVKTLNEYQKCGMMHPFTCCSPEDIPECLRTKGGPHEGLLVATTEGWVCPCGKYKQDWAHEFMADAKLINDWKERMKSY